MLFRSGGGGDGGLNAAGSPGTANTGGGGGGSGNVGAQGQPGNSFYGTGQTQAGAGGSGIVILRIPNTLAATFSAGLTTTADTSSVTGYNIYSVTAGTGTVSFAYV